MGKTVHVGVRIPKGLDDKIQDLILKGLAKNKSEIINIGVIIGIEKIQLDKKMFNKHIYTTD